MTNTALIQTTGHHFLFDYLPSTNHSAPLRVLGQTFNPRGSLAGRLLRSTVYGIDSAIEHFRGCHGVDSESWFVPLQ